MKEIIFPDSIPPAQAEVLTCIRIMNDATGPIVLYIETQSDLVITYKDPCNNYYWVYSVPWGSDDILRSAHILGRGHNFPAQLQYAIQQMGGNVSQYNVAVCHDYNLRQNIALVRSMLARRDSYAA